MKKCGKKIRALIRSTTNNSDSHVEKYLKIKITSGDDLLL